MSLFKRFFPPKVVIQHSVFGELVLSRGKQGNYWTHESSDDEEPYVSVETNGVEPPTLAQVKFYQTITNDLDSAFARVASVVAPQYELMLRRSLPADWRQAFRFSGLGVPLEGDERNPWDITFQLTVDNLGWLFVCYFEGGVASHVGVDT